MNADGWGVGWWDRAVRPEPARYRTASPMWTDRSFRSVAELVRSGAIVAAVRSATPGSPIEATGNAPFTAGPWLFSLNGYINGFRDGVGEQLRRTGSPSGAPADIEGTCRQRGALRAWCSTVSTPGRRRRRPSTTSLPWCSARTDGKLNLLLCRRPRHHRDGLR